MEYRLDKEGLLNILSLWNQFLKRKVHLIACGGTALTLQDIKSSTKDADFIIPKEGEYKYLIKTIQDLGYKIRTGSGWQKPEEPYIFDLYLGKRIHTTELLESPLDKENHILIKELQHLYLGALNHYDLIISKLFRGAAVDFEDCLALAKAKGKEIDFNKLEARFKETASYDISEDKILKHWDSFKSLLKKEKIL